LGAWDYFAVHRIDPAAGKAWGFSNVGRDKSVLIELDLATGRDTVLADHPVVDLGWAFHPRRGGGPVAIIADDGYPTIRYLDAQLGASVQKAAASAIERKLLDDTPRIVRPQSSSEDGQRWVLRALSDFDDAELLWDARTGQVTRLDAREPERKAWLSAEQPYTFRASDGRTIPGYLIRPRGVNGPAPLVVWVHGGPWARETWSPAGFGVLQMLANRGYAVLTVNYRASTGYGRDHMMAGAGVAYTRLQQDIAEAAQWAVDQGVADPKRMAVLGASFGGYSVLAQLARKDQDWRCGVDMVGVANWQRVIENWPPFWRNRHMFHTFFGNPAVPAERAKLLADSPISHVDKITAPLLVIHGANDIRVLREDSDDVVRELQRLGRPVSYLSFPNEGHSVRRWRNRLEMWRRVEDHLASCLGGRSSGWDYYELMPK
jgi:dipeptidyl aminopeptidase/acylaminoacyl peptidase